MADVVDVADVAVQVAIGDDADPTADADTDTPPSACQDITTGLLLTSLLLFMAAITAFGTKFVTRILTWSCTIK